ncbi:MAG: hypothetical protein ACOCVM_08905 [Desulfovibrionaceae bacterium]
MSKPKKKPVKYSLKIAVAICERVATGESLHKVCLDESMPEQKTAYRWLWERKEFRERYAWASRIKHGVWADKLVDIADGQTEEADPAKAGKLRMDALKNASQMLARAVVDRDDPGESEELSFEEIEARFLAMAKEDPDYARHLIHVLERGLAQTGQGWSEEAS